jgi:hypothetical protein
LLVKLGHTRRHTAPQLPASLQEVYLVFVPLAPVFLSINRTPPQFAIRPKGPVPRGPEADSPDMLADPILNPDRFYWFNYYTTKFPTLYSIKKGKLP